MIRRLTIAALCLWGVAWGQPHVSPLFISDDELCKCRAYADDPNKDMPRMLTRIAYDARDDIQDAAWPDLGRNICAKQPNHLRLVNDEECLREVDG